MYSKPKGLYVKNRDQKHRRLSPRTSDDTDERSTDDLDGRSTARVEVQNYGEGNISPSSEPHWPGEFEDDQTQVKTPVKSTANQNEFPERARKYMVSSGSYKDLTGDKFITVPTPNAREEDTEQKVRRNSVRSYSQVSQFQEKDTLPNRPVARVTGTYRGVPAQISAGKQSHIATIRLPSRKDSHKLHTVKAIPRDGHVKTVKSYHVGPYATLRPHNKGHVSRHMKAFGPTIDHSKGLGFHRSTYLHDKKEYSFSQFSIELDRPSAEHYLPGDVVSGKILLEAVSKVEIRFVELLIIGLASVHLSKNDPKNEKNAQEIVINKRSYVMGTPDGRYNSLITPGKYVSRFRFALPLSCPSSLRYENKEQGFSFEVGYLVKARICDEFGSSSARSNHSLHNYVKVLLSRRHPFLVRQPFDIHAIPGALQPVTHSEFVNLGCIPIFVEPQAINLSLDRSVFLLGDDIRVKLVTPGRTAHKIRSMTCNLQMGIRTSLKTRQVFNVVQVHVREPDGLVFQQDKKTFTLFEIMIPTQSQFIPSFLKGCNLINVAYSIVVILKFKLMAGKLFIEYPIAIGPSEDPSINRSRSDSVPVFIRPKRFPHFTKDSEPIPKIQNGTLQNAEMPQSARQATSNYKSQGSSLFCCGDDGDLI